MCIRDSYRVNSKGKFNVPCGKRDKIVCNKEKMEEISKKIQNVEFFCMDYNLFIDKILEKEKKKSIFMYCDPPYMPETESSQKHILYTQNGFEHERFIEYMDCLLYTSLLLRKSEMEKHMNYLKGILCIWEQQQRQQRQGTGESSRLVLN